MRTKWTVEMLKTEAQKFSKRTEFMKGNSAAYVASRKMGVLDEVCVHMPAKKYTKVGDKTVFVRYNNRKLYNTASSQYVTLKDILSLPVGTFVVMSHVTGADITTEILISAVTSYMEENPTSFEVIKNVLIENAILKG